jgi:CRISPR-associated protein Cmx8
MLVFVPSFVDSDGKERISKRSEKDKSSHYVIVIPEVSALQRFCELYPRILSRLGEEKHGYRPARAVLTIPVQGALEFISLAKESAGELLSRGLNTVEFYHLMRPAPKKPAVLIGHDRVPDTEDLINGYRDIVGWPGESPGYRNPLFKAALILALLRSKPWWGEMLPLFMRRDWRFFVQASDTAQKAADISRLPGFWCDAERRFQKDIRRLQQRKEVIEAMPAEEAEKHRPTPVQRLPEVIRRLVRNYVYRRAEERSGRELKQYRKADGKTDWRNVPQEFHEEKQKVAQTLFLEFRSRRDQAFVDHFSATFFSIGQYYDETNEDFETLSAFLLDREGERRDDVKTLTLQGLSAVSWTAEKKEEKGAEE